MEEQHIEEIDSYRKELNKRQREVDELRRLLSENRRAPSSEVMTIMKALQIKDNRLADEIEVIFESFLSKIFFLYPLSIIIKPPTE